MAGEASLQGDAVIADWMRHFFFGHPASVRRSGAQGAQKTA